MKAIIVMLGLLAVAGVATAGLLDSLGLRKGASNQVATANASALGALSEDQVIAGLKEALDGGVRQAVQRLGQEGGFLTNAAVKIPLPESLRTVERTLRKLKQEKLADDFVLTMNRAAEQAVPAAAGIFGDAIKGMNMTDAKAILSGPKDAATQYFRRTTETNLLAKFRPIVQTATENAGVTTAYKRLVERAKPGGMLGSLGGSFLNAESMDIDAYVTQKAADGLFKMVADEEKRIRENPAARASDLLQKVFGTVKKS